MVGLAATAWFLPLREVPELVGRLGPAAPAVGVVVGAALLDRARPPDPGRQLACGLLFGATVGAVCALLVALVARDCHLRRRPDARPRVRGPPGRAPVRPAGVRGSPGREPSRWPRSGRCRSGPYGLVGYAYGASAVRVRHYALGTLISAAPSAVSYALLGAAIASPEG